MTNETNASEPRRYVTQGLPWLVGAVALIVYGITLNSWVSLNSLGTVGRISGWLWQPKLDQPLTTVLLYLFRLLPTPWIPLLLNIFTAACGALVLVLLARSVALLPHDRTHDERVHEDDEHGLMSSRSAWLPPVLATVLCGLQLTFWEHATSATGEMVDLLVFAYIIRCVLEFRVSQEQAWLSKAAFWCAAGMTNNWAMIGFFPIFILALMWLMGLNIFRPGFLVRMIFWGLAGGSLYLLLPLMQSEMSFWLALKANLKAQKDALQYFPRLTACALGVSSLLPLLMISIRWKSQKTQLGEKNKFGLLVSKLVFRFMHFFLVLACVWMALDLPLSPRKFNTGVPLLTFYYLSALVLGYCAGYCLLVGSGRLKNTSELNRLVKSLAKVTAGLVFILLGVAPVALLWRNLNSIRLTNGAELREYAAQLRESLPAGKSVVLSDDPRSLRLLQAELAARGPDKDALLLDTRVLPWTAYQMSLIRRHPTRWPEAAPTNRSEMLGTGRVLRLVAEFAAREPVVYLHPSFGFLFEHFTERPHGLVHNLTPRDPKNPVDAPLDDAMTAANERYWEEMWNNLLQTLATQTREKAPGFRLDVEWLSHVDWEPDANATAAMLGAAYSRSLNNWGVQMQRRGRTKEAGLWFQRALDLKPDNMSAQINLLFHQRVARGDKSRLSLEAIEEQFRTKFEKYPNWELALKANGPVDEPTFLFEAGRGQMFASNFRQAVHEFARAADLAPDWLAPKLWLAQTHTAQRDFAAALRCTDSIQASGATPDRMGAAQLLFTRAVSLQGLGRTNEAMACIDNFVRQNPDQGEILSTAAQLYMRTMQYGSALTVLEQLVKREPASPELLTQRAMVELQLDRPDVAAETLTKALALAPSNPAVRLNRGIAFLRARQLDAATTDFQAVLGLVPNASAALSGLGEIAWRKKDTNAALRFYGLYLTNGLPKGPEARAVAERFTQLGGKEAR